MSLWSVRMSSLERRQYYFNFKTGESRWIPPADFTVGSPPNFATSTDLLDRNDKRQNVRDDPKLVQQEDSGRPSQRRRTKIDKQVIETMEVESERSFNTPVFKRRRISGVPLSSSYNEIGRWIGLPSSISIKTEEPISVDSALILDSILALRVLPGLPAEHLDPLVDKLTQAYEYSRSPAPFPALVSNPESSSVDDEPDWQQGDGGQSEGDSGSEQGEDGFTVDKLGHWNWTVPKYIVEFSTKIGRDALSEMEESRYQLEKYGIRTHPDFDVSDVDLARWLAHIPGIEGTRCEGGVYTVLLEFRDIPSIFVPCVSFIRPFFHPNVGSSGAAPNAASLVCPHKGIFSDHGSIDRWQRDKAFGSQSKMRMAKLLRSLQLGISWFCFEHAIQERACQLAQKDPQVYNFVMSIQAERWTPTEKEGLAGRPAVAEEPWSLDRILEATVI